MTYCLFPDDHSWAASLLGISICLLVISGYLVRVTAVLFAWQVISFRNLVATPDGGDQILANLAVLLVILSLFDNRKNHWHESAMDRDTSFRQTRLIWSTLTVVSIKVQMAYLYLEAGLAKTQVESWADGSEIYYILGSPSFGVPDDSRGVLGSLLMESTLIIQILTWGTIVIEVFIAYAIFGNIIAKRVAAVFVVMLHGLIAVFLGLPVFSLIMICGALYSLIPMGKLDVPLSRGVPFTTHAHSNYRGTPAYPVDK